MKIRIALSLTLVVFVTSSVLCQNILTHQQSEWEKAQNHTIGKDFTPTDPPVGVVRNVAEFEPSEGVLVRYPFGIPYTLIAEMSEDAKVTTIVANQSEQDQVISIYNQNGVNVDNCDFIQQPSDSYWTRDFGPWFIMIDNSEIAVVNFPYNRPRPNDNNIPIFVASHLGLDLYGMNLIHTGGNWMTDGMGHGAHTDLVLDENPGLSQNDVDLLVNDYLGIAVDHILDDPLGEYIKHVDCWGKFIGPDKILIGQVPQSDSRYQDFEDAANYWANTTSAYGTPYRVYRVYTPGGTPATPYSNSYIFNKKVFVPQSGSQWDDEALEAYEEAMPGYEVIGIYHTTWENTDALHCRTHEIADREMLYIHHLPLLGEQPMQDGYSITADIHALSQMPLYNDSIFVKYRINEGVWNEQIMTSMGDDVFSTEIAFPGEGFNMTYYIHAADESGHSENHPYIGKWDAHHFSVQAPGKPVCIVPANNSSDASLYSTLQWQDGGIYQAEEFIVSLGTDNPPTNIYQNVSVTDLQFKLPEKLEPNTTYFWQVKAVNQVGEVEGDIWTFTTLGEADEDFETGDFSLFNWNMTGDNSWTIDDNVSRNGVFCAKSGEIADNEISVLSLDLNCNGFGKIIWWGSSSSEENDYLRFYLDGILVNELSGDQNWQEFRVPTGPGPHSFIWQYEKDGALLGGDDCAYIDFIYLPDFETIFSVDAGNDSETCPNIPAQLMGSATGHESVLWTTSGDGDFSQNEILNPYYVCGNEDIEMGSVVLTLTVQDISGNVISDDLNLFILPAPVVPEMPLGPDTVYTYSTPSTTYSTNIIPLADDYVWMISPDIANINANGNQCTFEWTNTLPIEAQISVATTNSCGQSLASEIKQVFVIPDVTPGFENPSEAVSISIFPNPSDGNLQIVLNNDERNLLYLRIVDVYGRNVWEKNTNCAINRCFISNLLTGVYVLELHHENVKKNYKLVIR